MISPLGDHLTIYGTVFAVIVGTQRVTVHFYASI